jgi:hypothetical protein
MSILGALKASIFLNKFKKLYLEIKDRSKKNQLWEYLSY